MAWVLIDGLMLDRFYLFGMVCVKDVVQNRNVFQFLITGSLKMELKITKTSSGVWRT